MANPKRLKRIAIWVTVIPLLVSLISQCLIWLIPNCNPTPYSVERCVVAGHQFGPYVMAGLLGGLYVAALLGLVISVPLFVASMVVQRRSLRSTR
jgi:hypothetical protein